MPKIIDHDQRRKDILDASFKLFAELGYTGLSMRKMAKHMGMTTGMLYHYFENKESLFTALLQEKQTNQIASFYEQVVKSKDKQAAFRQFLIENEKALQQLLAIAIEFHRQHPDLDLKAISQIYEVTFQQHLNISEEEAKILLTNLLGELVRGLLGEEGLFVGWSPSFRQFV